MHSLLDEAKKHRSFRETWIGYLLGGIYLMLSFYIYWPEDSWYLMQQDIRCFGANLTAFLIAVSLPRLVCCEYERGTDRLIKTADRGCLVAGRSKALFAVIYCACVVLVIGAASLLAGSAFDFRGALSPVEECVYFIRDALPPMSNLAYYLLQYVFLFLGAVYFAGFVLLIATLTRRTALSVFISGAVYLACMSYEYVGGAVPGALGQILGSIYRFGFGGYLLQSSYSWSRIGAGRWSDLWKPVLLAGVMIALELAAFWAVWRRKARK